MNRKSTFAQLALVAAASGLAGGNALAGGALAIEFGDAVFASPLVIDNPYWPLLPGGTFSKSLTYVSEGEDECTINTISSTAGDVKMLLGGDYAGLTAQVIVDKEWIVDNCGIVPSDADVKEWTFDWYMQDTNDNIWYLGEDSRSFEDGCPSVAAVPMGTLRGSWPSDELFLECTEGSWEAGQRGQEEGEIVGEAGIVVPGEFPTGDRALSPGTYWSQEIAENAEDMAKVLRLNARVTIDDGNHAGDYTSCRMVKEYTLLDPGHTVEHKYYCRDVGLLLIEGIGGGPTEAEILVETTTL